MRMLVVRSMVVVEGNVSRIVLLVEAIKAIQWVRWMTMIATGEVLAQGVM
ncbi:hypothetical protein [Fictibacillus enclensis]|nr:hypothetical protein [Fictibacillus enclensis]WHY71069.1 hypothetical protein QNH15_18875 [Fictibacillus enclensis]